MEKSIELRFYKSRILSSLEQGTKATNSISFRELKRWDFWRWKDELISSLGVPWHCTLMNLLTCSVLLPGTPLPEILPVFFPFVSAVLLHTHCIYDKLISDLFSVVKVSCVLLGCWRRNVSHPKSLCSCCSKTTSGRWWGFVASLVVCLVFFSLGQDFAKSSAHVFSYILHFKLRPSPFWKHSSAGCRWDVSYSVVWREVGPPFPATSCPEHRSCPRRAAVTALPACPCPVSPWRWAGAEEVVMREKGFEGMKRSSKPGRLSGMLSPSCLPHSGTGAFCHCILI